MRMRFREVREVRDEIGSKEVAPKEVLEKEYRMIDSIVEKFILNARADCPPDKTVVVEIKDVREMFLSIQQKFGMSMHYDSIRRFWRKLDQDSVDLQLRVMILHHDYIELDHIVVQAFNDEMPSTR